MKTWGIKSDKANMCHFWGVFTKDWILLFNLKKPLSKHAGKDFGILKKICFGYVYWCLLVLKLFSYIVLVLNALKSTN